MSTSERPGVDGLRAGSEGLEGDLAAVSERAEMGIRECAEKEVHLLHAAPPTAIAKPLAPQRQVIGRGIVHNREMPSSRPRAALARRGRVS